MTAIQDATETPVSAVTARPVAGHIGADISGVDISKPLAPEQTAAMKAMSDKVQDQCKKNNLRFLGGPELRGGGEAGAIAGREMTKRKMPV